MPFVCGLHIGRTEGGQAGEENTGLLVGDVPGYGTGFRRRGGRTDENPFWDLQYPERK